MHPLTVVDKKPNCFSVEITKRCPLNCVYCHKGDELTKDIPTHDFHILKEQIDRVDSVKRVLFCGIGETFLHKGLYDIIDTLKDYKVSLITSGTIKIDIESLLKERNVDLFIVSVDAIEEKGIQEICGKNYNYKHLLYNLEQLSKYSKRTKNKENRKLLTVMNCTINDKNMYSIEDMVDFAHKYNFSALHFSLPWGEDDFIKDNAGLLVESFNKAITKGLRSGLYIEDPFKSFCCMNENRVTAYIGINGDVYPCGYGLHEGYIVGNLLENDFDSLWDNKKYGQFKNGTLCQTCYMYNFISLKEGS